MGHATKKEREEFVGVLAEAMIPQGTNGFNVALVARNLMRWGATQSRIAVALCNGEMEQDEYDKKTERLRAQAEPILRQFHIRAIWGGDPRGYSLKLILPNVCPQCNYVGPCTTCPKCVRATQPSRYNTWGGKEDGWGVPTS